MKPHRHAAAYRSVDVVARVASASPLQLIQMLYEEALVQVSVAKVALEQQELERKIKAITRAVDIVGALRESLCMEMKDSTLPYDLDRLYDYIQRRLLQANIHGDIDILVEVGSLLETLKSAWDDIEQKGC